MAYTSYGTATGQFTAGQLSSANTQTTTTSAGELRYVIYGTPEPQPVIALSDAFAEKAISSGIPVQQVQGISFVSNVDTSLEAFPISQEQQMREGTLTASRTPMLNAGNLLPLILIGGAFLLFTMKK